MIHRYLAGALVVAALIVPASASATVELVQVGDFDHPVYVTQPAGDARLFVVEQAGKIKAVAPDGTVSTYLDLTDKVVYAGGEQGLLSIAFANGKAYVYYNTPPPQGVTAQPDGSDIVIEEYDAANPTTGRRIATIPHRKYANHNGGQLQIGPDGALWAGTGDGGNGGDTLGNAQRLDPTTDDPDQEHDHRLGKLLRIDPATAPGQDPVIAEYGLRNPWRFSFDRATGDLVIGDVGQDKYEEIDYVPFAQLGVRQNFGWNNREGMHPFVGGGPLNPSDATPVDPVIEHGHGDGWDAITGGYVVRDPTLPDLAGKYVYGDFAKSEIFAASLAQPAATADVDTGLSVPSLSSFGEDAAGRVYAVSLDGPVYRLQQTGGPPPVDPVTGLPAPGPGAVDTTAPVVRVRRAVAQRILRKGFVEVTVTCDEQCAVSASGRFAILRGKQARAARALTTRTVKRTIARNARIHVRLGVAFSVRHAIKRAMARGRRATATVTLHVADGAGNRTTAKSRVRVRR